jgi:hypothetical protein
MEIEDYEFGLASNDITSIPNFIKMYSVVLELLYGYAAIF